MIIGLTGKMGVGKSTAIECIRDINSIFNIKFAAPLYEIQDFIYDVISRVYKTPEGFVKDRKLLQLLGTEWGRQHIKESLWLDLWKDTVSRVLKIYDDSIIITCDDVRFDNEAQAVKELGGIVIEIISDKSQNRIDTTQGISNHKSEAGVDKQYIDFVVHNNGTVEELKAQLYTIIKGDK